MTLLAERTLIGEQSPRILWVPSERASSLGADAAEWSEKKLGIKLDPWQELCLDHMLARRADGKWSAFEFGLVVPRQCGKSLVLHVRMLYGVFVLGERLVSFTAHLGDTALEQFLAVRDIVENAPEIEPLVASMPAANGKEGIILRSGCRIRFKTRTKGGGRGLSGDVTVLDEAQALVDQQLSALMPTMSAKSVQGNPQMLYAGSAGDFEATVLGRVRRRGIAGGDPRLGFMEWSIDDAAYLAADPETRAEMAADPVLQAAANPAYGLRISAEYVEAERQSMDPFEFARERMGVGSWPVDDSIDWPIPKAGWKACAVEDTEPPAGPMALAVDASWERTASVASCWARADGLPLGVVEHDHGVDWVVDRIVQTRGERDVCAVVIDDGGPAGSLVGPLEAAGVELTKTSSREYAQACGELYDAVTTGAYGGFAHRSQPVLNAALAGAKKRGLADAWMWDRRHSSTDISPLVAVTLARWGFAKFGAAGSGFNVW